MKTVVLACNKRVKTKVLRSMLYDLCEAGTAHYFERSDTYMIKDSP